MPNNLSDLGLITPAASNKLGSTPGLDELMGSDLVDEVGKSRLLETELARLGQIEPRTTLDILRSPGGLVSLLGSIAGMAAGGTARNVGIGALLGTLQQAQVTSETDRAQLAKAREELEDRLDKSYTRQDKMRDRIANIYNVNPEAFQGPDGLAPSPEVLGWYLTGTTDLPVWTSTRRALNERKETWDKRTQLLIENIKNAPTKEAARLSVRALLRQLDEPNPSDELVEAYMSGFGQPDAVRITWKNHYTNFGIGARDAHLWAVENGVGDQPDHPEVLRRLRAKTRPAEELTQLQRDLMAFIRGWERDPDNAQRVISIKTGAADPEEAQRLIIREAIESGNTYAGIDAAFLIDKINIEDPDRELMELLRVYGNVQDRDALLQLLVEEDLTEDILGMTRDEFIKHQQDTAKQEHTDLKQMAKDSDAQWTARQLDDIVATLTEQVPGFSLSTYQKSAQAVLARAQRDLNIKPGQPVPRADLEAAMKILVFDAVADLKSFKPE
jgi:hypothetical protein